MNEHLVKYHQQQLEYIEDFFHQYTFCIRGRTDREDYKKIICNNDGSCFTDIAGTYRFLKFRDDCSCKLEKCPNYILCRKYIIPNEEKNHYGLCYPCSVAYKLVGNGKGELKVFDNYKCSACQNILKSIEQPHCDHILCFDCFRIAHFNPGDNECPICFISTQKVMANYTFP